MLDFNTLKASDIMSKHVVAVAPDDTLEEALRLMTEHHVTGLPVVNENDVCIGIITASDILSLEEERLEESEGIEERPMYYNADTGRWEPVHMYLSLEEVPELSVSEVMTTILVSVTPETPLKQVAQKMHEEAVHRVLVLDKDNRIRGIVTATDFVRLIAERA